MATIQFFLFNLKVRSLTDGFKGKAENNKDIYFQILYWHSVEKGTGNKWEHNSLGKDQVFWSQSASFPGCPM